MNIYRDESSTNIIVLDAKITDESYRTVAVGGDDYLVLDFYTKLEVIFQRGDFVIWQGETFSIYRKPVPVMRKGVYHYNFKLYNNYKELEKVKVFFYDTARDLTQSDFPYTCTPAELVQLVVNNLNAVQGFTWSVGQVVNEGAKTITISNQNCLEVLSNAASEWNTEFYIENYTINLRMRVVEQSPLQELSLGTGVVSIEQEDNDNRALTRLYAFGGKKNLGPDYPAARLKMKIDYIDSVSGYDPPNPSKSGDNNIVEEVIVFDDIYPSRTGTISAVNQDSNGIYYFEDSGLDFDPNDERIDGLAMHVVFESGALVGYDFEANFNNNTQKFELIQFQEQGGSTLPKTGLAPVVGDTYKIYNITMPSSYIIAAEDALEAKAQAYFDENYTEKLSFNVTLDEIYFTKNDLHIAPGEIVTLKHPFIGTLKNGLNIRVTGFKQFINKPNKYDFVKISDTIYNNPITTIQNEVEEMEEVISVNNLDDVSYSRRNWRDAQELSTMIDSLQAKLLLIGYESGQFTLNGVIFTANYEGNVDKLKATAGDLIHKTVPNDENPGSWSIPEKIFTQMSSQGARYLYAKCSRTTTSGEWYINENFIEYDSDTMHYYFLIGVLSSINQDRRTLQTLFGFTEIAGNQITTGIIKSTDGLTYFDLTNGIISGNIMFISPDNQLETLIFGGYLNTNFIEANSLTADLINFDNAVGSNVTLSGTITATAGNIAGFDIQTYGITNITDKAYVLIRNNDSTRDARIGSSVFPAATGAEGVAYFAKTDARVGGTNIAAYFEASNAADFGHAFSIYSLGVSYLPKIAYNCVIVQGGKLSNQFRTFINKPTQSSHETVYLPDIYSLENNEVVRIAHYDSYNTYVKTDDGATINGKDTSSIYPSLTSKGDNIELMKVSENDWVILSLRGSF
jgi:hypothetical protein